jgi:predicted DNA-binding protein with PD1-like motif
MQALPLRLEPGRDLRAALESLLEEHGATAAFVLQAIGSLSTARIRFAGMPQGHELHGDMEILTLGGSLSPDGAHLHISVADALGRVTGGHVEYGCMVRTTAEILVALLPAARFSREVDPLSGYKELVVGKAD